MGFKVGIITRKLSSAKPHPSTTKAGITLDKKIAGMGVYPPSTKKAISQGKAGLFEVLGIVKKANQAYKAMKQGALAKNVDALINPMV